MRHAMMDDAASLLCRKIVKVDFCCQDARKSVVIIVGLCNRIVNNINRDVSVRIGRLEDPALNDNRGLWWSGGWGSGCVVLWNIGRWYEGLTFAANIPSCHCSVIRKLWTLRYSGMVLLRHLSQPYLQWFPLALTSKWPTTISDSTPMPHVIAHNWSSISHIIPLITHHYDGYLGVVSRDAAPGPGLVPGVRCVSGRAAGAGAAWEERSQSVVCWHRPRADIRHMEPHMAGEITSDSEWWHPARSRDHSRILPECQHAQSAGAVIWSSIHHHHHPAPAQSWHPPPTQHSSGPQWNYLNVPRENIHSGRK